MDDVTSVNYLDHIRDVAEQQARGHDRESVEWKRLKDFWEAFERTAEERHYQILETEELKPFMERILWALYELGGDPRNDEHVIRAKDHDYGGSWCKRGGPGAFMMLARKWDRIVKQVKDKTIDQALREDVRQIDGIADDVNDLRCYVILCLAFLSAKRVAVLVDIPF